MKYTEVKADLAKMKNQLNSPSLSDSAKKALEKSIEKAEAMLLKLKPASVTRKESSENGFKTSVVLELENNYRVTRDSANDIVEEWLKEPGNKLQSKIGSIKMAEIIMGNQSPKRKKDLLVFEEDVLEYIEKEGITRSDAQSLVDAWEMNGNKFADHYKGFKPAAEAKALAMIICKQEEFPESDPDCEELLKGFRDQKAKRRDQANKPAPTPAKTVEKAVKSAENKIEAKEGKISKTQQKAIESSMIRLIDSIKGNKPLIESLIEKLKKLL